MADLRRRATAAWNAWRRATTAPAQAFPPGAFYSPIVDAASLTAGRERARVWPDDPDDPAGIDMREAEQLQLVKELGTYALPDPASWPAPRYDPANDQFPPQDAAVLYGMVRSFAPARMVEVGCGWSTTVTTRAIRDGELGTELTCVEPYPRDFLHRLEGIHQLREEKVEHTPAPVFAGLGAGDVLFIDSSHVAKTGSDVVHLLLDVVPRLADGVVVHVHDVFIPFDYPEGWVRAGFNWNEQYLLQAYLSGNARAHVLCANRWLSLRHPDAMRDAFGSDASHGGSSVWFVTGPLDARAAGAGISAHGAVS